MSERKKLRIKDLVGFSSSSTVKIYRQINDQLLPDDSDYLDLYIGEFKGVPASLLNSEICIMYPDCNRHESFLQIQIV